MKNVIPITQNSEILKDEVSIGENTSIDINIQWNQSYINNLLSLQNTGRFVSLFAYDAGLERKHESSREWLEACHAQFIEYLVKHYAKRKIIEVLEANSREYALFNKIIENESKILNLFLSSITPIDEQKILQSVYASIPDNSILKTA